MARAESAASDPARGAPTGWLFLITAALLLGQALANVPFDIPASVFLLAFLIALCASLLRPRRYLWLLLVSIPMLAVGYSRHRQLLLPDFGPEHIHSLMSDEEPLYIEGVLSQEPEKLANRSRWWLRCERIWQPTGAQEIVGNIVVSVHRVSREWQYGDRIRAVMQPRLPSDSGNPGGFNYKTYLLRRGVHATAFLESDGNVELVGRDPHVVRGFIESLRRRIRFYFERHMSPGNAALMKALVVGDMGEISKQMRYEFTAAGVNHVLSISGLHVAMLGVVVFWAVRWGCSFSQYLLLRWNLIKIATFCSFFAVVFYTALAGAMVPTVRSAIMIGVYELAVLLDREDEVLTSLTFAALLIAIVWPGVIADISFQLSFVAVFFIAWGMRRIYGCFPAQPKAQLPQEQSRLKLRLRQIGFQLAVPLLGTIGTGPLIAHYFGHLSLAGFLSNPVIVPLVGFIVVPLGLLTGFLSLILPQAASVLVWLTEWPLSLTVWLVAAFSHLPLAHIGVPAPNAVEVAVLYIFVLSLVMARESRYALLATIVATLFLVADGSFWWRERWARKELRVTHLNVGNGDAALVELPGSKVLLIDAGGRAIGDFDTGEGIVAPFLRTRKILGIDYLFVSHPRIDHYGGMRSILNEFAAKEFWSGTARGRTERFNDLEETLEKTKIKRVKLSSADPCRFIDAVKFCVLFAPHNGAEDTSVVLRLEFGNVAFLFAGDIDKRDERFLRARGEELRSTVLKVPRHGSTSANSPDFIAMVHPRVAVFSMAAPGARGRGTDEVAAGYRHVGAEILRTYEDGAIILETDGSTIRYQGYKSGKRGKIVL